MHINDFVYQLPTELIASYPTVERGASRLLCMDSNTGKIRHQKFSDLIDFLNPNDLLVLNNTRVIKARLFGHKVSGGKVEILVERILSTHHVLARVKSSKSVKIDSLLQLEHGLQLKVLEKQGLFYHLECLDIPVLEALEKEGHVPLPPYLGRLDDHQDLERYQTVYANVLGAVAAPTAGLHFDESLLKEIQNKGVSLAYVTLHTGSGTFQPIRVDDITTHQMHSEYMEVSEKVCEQVAETRRLGGRVIAVGTTSVRCLETAAKEGVLKPYLGETNLFITPGFAFQVVDALITNFHLSQSTLLILVSAFAGREQILSAYQEAIKQRYRFYSYGDAMFLTRKTV